MLPVLGPSGRLLRGNQGRQGERPKLDALQAQCEKEGCTKESMDKFMASAKRVLSNEQYAQLKAACANMQTSEKTKS